MKFDSTYTSVTVGCTLSQTIDMCLLTNIPVPQVNHSSGESCAVNNLHLLGVSEKN